MKSYILMLSLLTGSVIGSPIVILNMEYDGSEKEVQKFIDDFHEAIRSGDRHRVEEKFLWPGTFHTCEKDHWEKDELINYTLAHGSNISLTMISASRHSNRFSSVNPSPRSNGRIISDIVVTGYGKKFLIPATLYKVYTYDLVDDTKWNASWKWEGSYSINCDFEKRKNRYEGDSQELAYDLMKSFLEALKSKDRERILDYFSDDLWAHDRNCMDTNKDLVDKILDVKLKDEEIVWSVEIWSAAIYTRWPDELNLRVEMYMPYLGNSLGREYTMKNFDGQWKFVDHIPCPDANYFRRRE